VRRWGIIRFRSSSFPPPIVSDKFITYVLTALWVLCWTHRKFSHRMAGLKLSYHCNIPRSADLDINLNWWLSTTVIDTHWDSRCG
jgi:hypothetical protein